MISTTEFSRLHISDDPRELDCAQSVTVVPQSKNNVNLGLVGTAYHSARRFDLPGDWRSLVRLNPLLTKVLPDLWRKVFDQEGLSYFDEVKCRKYHGEPGDVPPLSWHKAYEYFHSPCPLFLGKLVKETHKLQLFYKEIDGIPMTLNHAGTLAKKPKEGSKGVDACFHEYSWPKAFEVHGEVELGESFWAFVTVKPLEGSVGVPIEEKLKLAAKHPQYRLHRGVERSIANFDNVVETGEYLDGPGSYTICEETVKHNFGLGEQDYHLAMGGARAPGGLNVRVYIDFDYYSHGVVLLRKF